MKVINQILETPPYQLPPVVSQERSYYINIKYLGEKYEKEADSLQEVLEGYLQFVIKNNEAVCKNLDVLREVPVAHGKAIYPKSIK